MNISVDQFQKMMEIERNEVEIIDVREKEEFLESKIRGSKLIPLSEISSRQREIDWNKKVILVCRSGARSSCAAEILKKDEKEVFNLEGGIEELQSINFKYLEL